eukprot:19180-Heterococcus_DN1.PRE.4
MAQCMYVNPMRLVRSGFKLLGDLMHEAAMLAANNSTISASIAATGFSADHQPIYCATAAVTPAAVTAVVRSVPQAHCAVCPCAEQSIPAVVRYVHRAAFQCAISAMSDATLKFYFSSVD